MEEKPKKEVKVKPLKEVKTKSNRVYGKDWIFSGQSKNFPKLLDIRYEKDLKLQERQKKKREFSNLKKNYILRKPKMLD